MSAIPTQPARNGRASQNSPHSSLNGTFAVVILAAGKGTRMNNPDKAKVMFEIAGSPMIDYVVRQAFALEPERVIAVVGFQKQSVMEHLNARFEGRVVFAHQDRQLGTGHAVMQTRELLHDFDGDALILSGDVPLLRRSTAQAFALSHAQSGAAASVLTVDAPDPTGYGRIARDASGNVERIVEHKDASEEERALTEINSGIYLVKAPLLFEALARVSNHNAQNEYYLTDIIGILRADGHRVVAWKCDAFEEVHGINTLRQLEEAEEILSAAATLP